MNSRFTIDGSDSLEAHLKQSCARALEGVYSVVPAAKLEALILGGGYGRGQGGVLQSHSGDKPYNDLEFYVFTRGNIIANERRYRRPLQELGDRLSPDAGLHVEFKVYSNSKLRRPDVSMFTYDLVSGHKVICGNESVFDGCAHHRESANIPPSEATRLLFNRCSGLLLADDKLRQRELSADDADFVGRNFAKAQLAFGDAVLTTLGKYHWSCLERQDRLVRLAPSDDMPWLAEVRECHSTGVDFKLHPRITISPRTELQKRHADASALGNKLWLWLESKRLGTNFASARDYALSNVSKCPETSGFRNALLNIRTFGPASVFRSGACRYPRERLMEALCLLLWTPGLEQDSEAQHRLTRSLQTPSSGRNVSIPAYQRIWQFYG